MPDSPSQQRPTHTPTDAFIARWRANEGGAERANYVLFLTELCTLLGLPQPDPADATHDRNDYVFERAVEATDAGGQVSHRRIDLYRRGCFVLEAKQSREPGGKEAVALADQPGLPGMTAPERGRRSAQRGWDVLMRNAREQAEQYARALPVSHGWPPFILVCDVGHAIELFADFSGQGKNYRQFPDRATYRIGLDDLHDPDICERLRLIWRDPLSLDPARRSALVTRDIAGRLANVSRLLEARGRAPAEVANFLSRCLFTMFAQSPRVRLLDPGDFTAFLDEARGDPASFAPLLENLWLGMDKGDVSALLRKRVRHFNGGLFKEAHAIPLAREEIGELLEASRHDWADVEPAIFGTLLEQALDPVERRRLGAHYTPRTYVERLVTATVIEPLQAEWTAVLGTVERERHADRDAAVQAVHLFHVKLAQTRILDPACGTGNFLYVALELMKRLEGEVLDVLAELGGADALRLETETVHPKNFLGLEVNARAAAITELVLWLGYIQWQLRNGRQITDPVLEELRTIERRDAVLLHDGERVKADRSGTELINPRRPLWPQADYIVGNPPFIGGKDLRGRLGDVYVTALWRAHPGIGRSADFVTYWWDHAAELLTGKGTRLKRFGLVTTNSITQAFSRRVLAKRLDGRPPVSIVWAVPDHPWTKATRDAAAVRIAMTAAEAGSADGRLLSVTGERGLDTATPVVTLAERVGRINADLSVGADVTGAAPLLANEWLCSPGVKLHGSGFIVTPAQAAFLGLGRREGLERHIRPYRHGRDLTGRSRDVMVIDLLGLSDDDVRRRYPEVYQHLLTTVKPERDGNARATYRNNWWLFGEPRRELRPALAGLPRYIATVETAKHRVFQFLDAAVLPDNMLVCIASDDPFHLGVLNSRANLAWTAAQGGTLEDRPRYTKTQCFDPFPFPLAMPAQRATVGALADELDAARKEVLAAHPDLTLTGLYNLLAKAGSGEPLDLVEQDRRQRGRIDLLAELHARIDAAVADAYGWPVDMPDNEAVARLLALNAQRRADERRGRVQWLRPAYQQARAGVTAIATAQDEQLEVALPAAAPRKPAFPRDAVGQTAAVFDALRTGGALSATGIALRFSQGRRIEPRVAATLAALQRLGHVTAEPAGFRLRRAA